MHAAAWVAETSGERNLEFPNNGLSKDNNQSSKRMSRIWDIKKKHMVTSLDSKHVVTAEGNDKAVKENGRLVVFARNFLKLTEWRVLRDVGVT